MRNKENNSKIVIFDNYFFNLVFSVTIPPDDFKFCLISLHTHSEGTLSQIFEGKKSKFVYLLLVTFSTVLIPVI